jgi:hypothetical protein
LTARVFVVHTVVIVFVLVGLGLLSLGWPELLLAPSDLARLLLYAISLLWVGRLLVQVLLFDAAMTTDAWASARWIRAGAPVLWAGYAAVYGAALLRQLGLGGSVASAIAPFDFASARAWIRLGIAAVWLLFVLVFKALGALPRHSRIVARVVGERAAGPVTTLVALAEVSLALWMFAGRALPLCAFAQTVMIVAMNAFELRYARDLLVAPAAMVGVNAVFLVLGWYVAL